MFIRHPSISDTSKLQPWDSTRSPTAGYLWLRLTGDELLGVFTGEASFVNARDARTSLGQVRFQRLPDP